MYTCRNARQGELENTCKPDIHCSLLPQWTCVKKTREQWGKNEYFHTFCNIFNNFLLCIREHLFSFVAVSTVKFFSTVGLESLRFSAVMTLCLYHNWIIKSKCTLDSCTKFSDFISNGSAVCIFLPTGDLAYLQWHAV